MSGQTICVAYRNSVLSLHCPCTFCSRAAVAAQFLSCSAGFADANMSLANTQRGARRWHQKQLLKQRRMALPADPPGNGGAAHEKPFKRRSAASMQPLVVETRASADD